MLMIRLGFPEEADLCMHVMCLGKKAVVDAIDFSTSVRSSVF